jgi:NitT/TauT family transport system substrate-binding protein
MQALITAATVTGALTACGGGGESGSADAAEGELTHVRLAIPVTGTDVSNTDSSLPLALGFWEEEGLDVEVSRYAGGSASIQALVAGQADVSNAATSVAMAADQAGTSITSFYTVTTKNIFVPRVPADSDIETVEDFKGKTIGLINMQTAALPTLRGMLRLSGLDPDSDVQFVPVGTGPEALAFAENGDVDVLGLPTTSFVQLDQLGLETRGVSDPFFSDVLGWEIALNATDEYFEANRDVLIGLARGIAKTMVFIEENPEAAIRVHWDMFPDSKPVGVSDEKAMEQALALLEVDMADSTPTTGVWGDATPEEVEARVDVLIEAGELPADATGDSVWTDEILAEVNDFDVAAIKKMAAEYE